MNIVGQYTTRIDIMQNFEMLNRGSQSTQGAKDAKTAEKREK
jgi:hypothetical protein